MITFNIEVLKAYSSGIMTEDDWRKWAYSNFESLPPSLGTFKPSLIPMMQARRMGFADKMAIQLAMEMAEFNNEIDGIVFASRHGQLMRTYNLLSKFFATGEMSPIEFATAVHNAPAGQFSILSKKIQPISSVSAEEGTFIAGLIDSIISLSSDKKRILFVMFDDDVPAFYLHNLAQHEQSSPYAIAMLLTAGQEWKMYTCESNENGRRQHYPCGLHFLREFYRNSSAFDLMAGSQRWHFIRS